MIVSFDLDGVLMENPFSKGIFPYIKNELKSQYENHHNQPIKEEIIWKNIKYEFRQRIKSNLYTAYDWDDIIQKVANDLRIPGKIDISELIKEYLEEPYIHLYQDGKELLDKLQEANIELFVVTNGYYKYQYPVLEALGINNYFTEIITTDGSEAVKPQGEIFKSKLTESNNWIHIGDSPLMDVYGANKLSATSILVFRELSEDLLSLLPSERAKSEFAKELINDELDKELSLNKWEYEEDLIYPDYLVKSLDEVFPILKKIK